MHSLCCGGIFLWLSGGSRAPSPFVTNLQNSVSKIPDLAQKMYLEKYFYFYTPFSVSEILDLSLYAYQFLSMHLLTI